MDKFIIAGLEINKTSLKELFFNKTMLLAYLFLILGFYGVYEVFDERYFSLTANARDAGLNPGSREVAMAMKEAIFGDGGEVKREAPWTLYIVNYMYMIYTGSAIIFFVALAELFNVQIIKKTAAGFMTFGLSMVFGGLFTIAVDLNILHMLSMFLTPNITAGMWLMLPLYAIYIPFVCFEIYLLLTKNKTLVKKIAWIILLISIVIDLVEYYIQAKLFDMNTARHLWTTYPLLTLYFIVSAFVAGIAVMLLYTFIVYKEKLQEEFMKLVNFLRISLLYCIALLAMYEAVAYLFIDKKWGAIILFGEFKYYFYIYLVFAVGLPFLLNFKSHTHKIFIISGAFFAVIGTYIGRYIFVYGGNAYPMSNRFGTGFEKYSEYEVVKEFLFFLPHFSEVLVVIGSLGVVLAAYKFLDTLLSVSTVSQEH
ncbi:NrfD/PsrC family molybdoenzyme membrane anchor subunit [Sulfurimonas sp.]|uniref:NrfD/PsrC family molybdoenzyme membrane anchor subunit n=1 Tax=Sulfurimonas sp. TaxID=2022749 RepID=UPI0026335308|nr:NrfD/PsrC family molybdoenzyme membrane anchor subunit [Sulfurimonas sp.]